MLLGQQTALQPVRQTAHCQIVAGELLVEKAAQARQLLVVAKCRRGDSLVEFGRKHLVTEVVWGLDYRGVGPSRWPLSALASLIVLAEPIHLGEFADVGFL